MEMASILFDEGIGERPLTIGLPNTLSPLSYSSEMLETLLVYPRTATQVLSVPEGRVSGDGLAHACGAGHTDPADFAAADGGGHLPLERRRGGHNRCGWSGADGQSIYTTTTHLSTYAAL